MPKVVIPVKKDILEAAERRKAAKEGENITHFLADLINLGFEHRFQDLYRQFESGEISLGFFAKEIGMGMRDLYAALEQRGLPTSNIDPNSSNLND